MSVCECGIDDVRIADAEQQFMNAYARQHVRFAEQAFVGRSVQFEQTIELGIVVRKTPENAFLAKDARDEPVCVVLSNRRKRRIQRPPRRASSICRTRIKAGTPPLIIKARGASPPNSGLEFGRVIQASASLRL